MPFVLRARSCPPLGSPHCAALLLFVCALWLTGVRADAQVAASDSATSAATVAESEVEPESESGLDGGTGASGLDYEQTASQLAAWYPVDMVSFADVVENSYNWRGPEDASVRCEIGFAPAALVVRGVLQDDVLFYQTMASPAKPDWWRITYGADGLEFAFDDPTSAAQHVQIALNFGPHAVAPQVELLASPLGVPKGRIANATLEVTQTSAHTAEFRAVIPYTSLADPKLFAGPLRMTLRLHDVDGAPETYLKMEKVLDKN